MTVKHFLLDCQELETVRKPIFKDFINICDILALDYPMIADLSLVQLLVDPSVIQDFCDPGDKKVKTSVELLHFHTRRLTYILHSTRYYKLELVGKALEGEKAQQFTQKWRFN